MSPEMALLGPSEDTERKSAPQGTADVHGAVGLRPSLTQNGSRATQTAVMHNRVHSMLFGAANTELGEGVRQQLGVPIYGRSQPCGRCDRGSWLRGGHSPGPGAVLPIFV